MHGFLPHWGAKMGVQVLAAGRHSDHIIGPVYAMSGCVDRGQDKFHGVDHFQHFVGGFVHDVTC